MRQLDVMNEVYAADAAEHLSLRLSMTSSSVVLNLRRNQFIDDQTPVYVARDGRTVRWTAAPANQVPPTKFG